VLSPSFTRSACPIRAPRNSASVFAASTLTASLALRTKN
jgi:hypothetical protein